ncbi:MAG: hypothetical protein ACE5HX_07525 [bacterium]
MNPGKSAIERMRQYLSKQQYVGKNKPENIIYEQEMNKMHLHVVIKDCDKFSFLLEGIQFKFTDESQDLHLNWDSLKKYADNLIKKVTYLLEDLSIVEEDPVNSKLLIRSAASETEIPTPCYYEIIMTGNGTISLNRFKILKEQKQRVEVPFNLTNEVLEKLINDVAGCMQKLNFE